MHVLCNECKERYSIFENIAEVYTVYDDMPALKRSRVCQKRLYTMGSALLTKGARSVACPLKTCHNLLSFIAPIPNHPPPTPYIQNFKYIRLQTRQSSLSSTSCRKAGI